MSNEFNDGRPWKAKHLTAAQWPVDPWQNVEVPEAGGVSLRDYFAAKAIPTATKWEEERPTGPYSERMELTYKGIATRAYLLADAMLAARKEGA